MIAEEQTPQQTNNKGELMNRSSIEDIVNGLAGLHPLEYESVRTEEAKRLNVRLQQLDQSVEEARQKLDVEDEVNSLGIEEATPWHEEVEGKELFAELVITFNKYLSLQKHQAEALALWSIFSYNIDANNIAPKLLIHSPEKRCGKTTLLEVLIGLVWKAIPASNISSAVIYRVIDDIGGTIVIDEADTFLKNNPETNGIINSGHRKSSSYVLRCDGDNNLPRSFSTWSPTVIAMIGKPTDTIVDRSILIEMKRKKPEDNVERFIPSKVSAELKILASKIARWSKDNFAALSEANPDTPAELNDRAADNWRPLFAIADRISVECSLKARAACLELASSIDDEDGASIGTLLLQDIKSIFDSRNATDRISTQDVLELLHSFEERPWAGWNRGHPMNAHQLSKQLKSYGLHSKKIRFKYETLMGYEKSMFEDAFERYLSGTSEQEAQDAALTTCFDEPDEVNAIASMSTEEFDALIESRSRSRVPLDESFLEGM